MSDQNDRKIELVRTVESLVSDLKNKADPNERAKAASALGKIQDERAVEPLISALKGDNPSVRSARHLLWVK